MDKESLTHMRSNCKYHIVFTPKYRRQVIYGQLRKDIGVRLRTLCERKGVTIIEAATCKDHIHIYYDYWRAFLKIMEAVDHCGGNELTVLLRYAKTPNLLLSGK